MGRATDRDRYYDRERGPLNLLLPEVPIAQVDVTSKDFKATRSYPRTFAIASAAITVLALAAFSMAQPRIAGESLLSASVEDVTIEISPKMTGFLLAIGLLFGIALIVLSIKPLKWRDKITKLQKCYFLGTQEWTTTQRIRACLVYSVTNPWCFAFPAIMISFRLVLALLTMKVYLRQFRQDFNVRHAFVVSLRFTDFFTKASGTLAGGILVIICVINLLQ